MIAFIFLIVLLRTEYVSSDPKTTDLQFQQDGLEFVEPEEIYCFNDPNIKVCNIHTASGIIDNDIVIQSMSITISGKSCQKILKYFTCIILNNVNRRAMMLVNKEFKNDYKNDNSHLIYQYSKNNFECFTVGLSKKSEVSSKLFGFTYWRFWTTDKEMVCLIFNSIDESVSKEINFNDDGSVLIEYERYSTGLREPRSLFGSCDQGFNSRDISLASNCEKVPNHRTICFNTQQHRFYDLKVDGIIDNNFKPPRATNCYTYTPRENKFCLRLQSKFQYLTLKPIDTTTSMIVFDDITIDKNRNSYNIGDIFCRPQLEFLDKSDLLIGYYNDKTSEFCIVVKEIYGIRIFNTTKSTITVNGCNVDPTQSMYTKTLAILDQQTPTICVHRKYTTIVSNKLVKADGTKVGESVDDYCWIEFPAKRCYYLNDFVKYTIMMEAKSNLKIYVYHKKYVINQDAKTDYLYRSSYDSNHLICLHKNNIKGVETMLNDEKNDINPFILEHEGQSVCFMADETLNKNIKIVIKDIGGCVEREITFTKSDNININRSNDEYQYCFPFFKNVAQNKSILILESNDHIKNCLETTCTNVVDYISLVQSDENLLSQSYTQCRSTPSINCIIDNQAQKSLIIYRTYHHQKLLTLFVTTNDELPMIISEQYNSFYHDTYGKNEIVCFLKDKIKNFNENDHKLKNDKIVCRIVEELKQSETIQIENFMGGIQEIQLDPSVDITHADRFQNNECLFLTNDEGNLVTKMNHEKMKQCLKLTCNLQEYFVKIDGDEINESAMIIECKRKPQSDKCSDTNTKTIFSMVINNKIPNGKYIDISDDSISIKKIEYYRSQYTKNDFICFNKEKIHYNKNEWLNKFLFERKNKHMCVFPILISEDLTLSLNVNKFCNRSIVFKNSDNLVTEESLESKCDKFINGKESVTEPTIKKYEDVQECLKKLCITLNYVITLHNENIDCSSIDCYNSKDFKYMKATSQYNNRIFFILQNDVFESYESNSTTKAFYFNSYYSHDLICIKNDILEDQSNQYSKVGLASLTPDIMCYFPRELSANQMIKIKNSEGCNKEIQLHKNHQSINRIVEARNKEIPCLKFVEEPEERNILSEMSYEQLLECRKSTCFKISFVVQKSKDQDDPIDSATSSAHDGTLDIQNAKNFEYIGIYSNFYQKVTYIKNLVKPTKVIPQPYFYMPSYYRDESVCINSKIVGNLGVFNHGNSFRIDDNICIVTPLMGKETDLQIIVNQHCNRTIGLYHDKTREESDDRISNESKCKPFFHPTNLVNTLSVEEIKKCLEQTCSKVLRYVEITKEDEPMISGDIKNCGENDYTGSCLNNGKEYDFIEVTNDYVTEFLYFRTQDVSERNKGYSTYSYYKPSYGPDKVVCMKKDLIVNMNSLKKSSYIYIYIYEDNRVCFLNNKLTQDVNVTYKINNHCNLKILLKNQPIKEGSDTEELEPEACQSFISLNKKLTEILPISRKELDRCTQITCSTIRQVVVPSSQMEDSSSKELISCDSETKLAICTENLNSADAIQVVSPFHEIKFYVSIKDKNTLMVPDFTKHYYYDEYYSDEIFCINKSAFTIQTVDFKDLDVIITGNKLCLVIKDLGKDVTIRIKQFNKCDKSINLKFNAPLDKSLARSNCLDFLLTPKLFPIMMTTEKLKQCIDKTCSKLHYLVNDDDDSNVIFEKSLVECKQGNGDSSCIKSDAKYHFAKVTNPSLSKPLYFRLDKTSVINPVSTNRFFYKSEYYNDKVVCFQSSMINEENVSKMIHFVIRPYNCIVNWELKKDQQIIQELGSCNRTITLKNESFSTQSSLLEIDEKCKNFLQNPTSIYSVNQINIQSLNECVTHTCSVVHGGVDVASTTDNWPLGKYTSCKSKQEGNTCLDSSKNYDFIKVTNHFVSMPMYFRTEEIKKPTKILPPNMIFYNSTYSGDDVVCFDKDELEISSEDDGQRGIFNDSMKTCIVINEFSDDITLKHKIVKECTRDILFSKSSRIIQVKNDREFEKKCQAFITQSESGSRTHDLLKDDILTCLDKTCSSITLVSKLSGKDNSVIPQACSDPINVEECLNKISDTDTLSISSPFSSSIVKIRKSDNEELRYNSSDVLPFYENDYYGDQVLCIRDVNFIGPDKIKLHQATRQIGDKYCILVNKLDEDNPSITVKQFGKCEKTINLHPMSVSASNEQIQKIDKCRLFYTSHSEQHKQMSLAEMKECVKSTCSKIKYYVRDTETNTNPMMQITKCASIEGQDGCLDDVSNIHFAKISNDASDGDITVTEGTHRNIDKISYKKYFYKQSLSQNDVVCLPTKDLEHSSFYRKTVSFSTASHTCIVGTELEKGSKISLRTSSGCIRHMIITGSEKTKSDDEDNDDAECALFIKLPDETKAVKQIDRALFNKCFVHTCSQIESAVELDSRQPLIQSERIVCNLNNNCLHQDKKYDFIKVKNDYLNDPIYFRTFDPESNHNYLPVFPFLYQNILYKNDVLCFRNDRLPLKEDEDAKIHEMFTETKRSCLLLSELGSEIKIKVPIDGGCHHNITLKTSVKPRNYHDRSEEMKQKCQIFFTLTSNPENTHLINKETILKCVPYTCSRIISFVQLESDSDSYSSRSLTSCGTDPNECLKNTEKFENMKIYSPYLNSTIYVRSNADKSDNRKVSQTTQYLDSYSNDDVVCIHEDLIIKSTEIKAITSKFRKNNAYCIVAIEVPPDTNINIKQYGHCKKTITINPLNKDTSSVDECNHFYSSESPNPLTMKHEKLLRCIRKTCSKVDYYVSNKDVSDLRSKPMKECDTNYGEVSCIQNKEDYQIIKVSNPSRSASLFVKLETLTTSIPPEQDDSSKLPRYFYKSDYFNDDIVCIKTNDIIDKDEMISTYSYTVDEETCIIVKELNEKNVVKVKSGKVHQEINLLPKPTSEERKNANSKYKKCQLFIKQTDTDVNLMPLNTLKECISFTKSEIESYHEINDKSLNSMIGTIEKCNNPSSSDECLVNTKVYDYIKVKSEFVEKPIYLRTSENTQKSSKSTIEKVYYKTAYDKDDIICFETDKIVEPENFRKKAGFFVHENKTCVIGSDLTTTTNVKITMTTSCSRTIQISNAKDVTVTDNTEETCSHFVTETQHSSKLPIYNISMLSECIKSTCSRIVSYVARRFSPTQSILKKVITCNSVTSDISCLGGVTEYDALEIYSPITNHTFYLQSSTANAIDVSFYLNAQYSEFYYKDEVVCAHDNFVEKGIYDDSKVVFTNNKSHCFIVKETKEGDILNVKLHGHCNKVIKLIPSDSSEGKTQSPLVQQCRDFYTAHKKLVTMNLDQLSQCVEYTCSKINYFLNEFGSASTDVNTVSECDSKYGKSDCISSNNPYMVKLTNPTSPNIPIYVRNEKQSSIHSSDLEKLFYKDEYGQDEFVCFKENMLTSNHQDLSIPSENSVKCLVGRDLKQEITQISMRMIDGCNKDIKIHKSTEAPQESSLESDKCHRFYLSSINKDSHVTLMNLKTLRECIIRTCSKVDSFVLSEKVNDISSIVPLTKCDKIHGNADCLIDGQNYDFIKIKNSFLTTPLLYRTDEPFRNAVSQRKLPLFYSSFYSDETLVCFANSNVLNQGSLRETWIHKEASRICVLVSDVTSTTKLTLKVINDCSRDITFTAKGSPDFQSIKESDTVCRSFYDPTLPNLVSLTIEQLKSCLTLTCSTINNQTIRNMLDSCRSDDNESCQSQLKSLRIELESPYRHGLILVIPPETQAHLSKLGNDPSKYSLVYSKYLIPCVASTTTNPLPEDIVKYSNDEDTLNCYAFKSSDPEYVAAINKSESTNLDIYTKSDIQKQLESAYELHVDLYTFDSELKSVSQSLRASVPFGVLDGKAVTAVSNFDGCQSVTDHSDPIVMSNYSTFIRGYVAIIPKNPFFSHNLTFYVKKRKACAGYLEDSNIEIKFNKYVVPQATHQCLLVFNSYLAMQFNTDNHQLNVTEDLDAKCLTSSDLEKLCIHTHEFTQFITLCYSKEMTSEEESVLQAKSEEENQDEIDKSLDIHVYLKNDECYIRKVTMSQRVGFCEIKEGYVQITLFSFDSFLKTVFRKSMIAPSEEYTLLVAVILMIGLMVSYFLIQVNKEKSNSDLQFNVPLVLLESLDISR